MTKSAIGRCVIFCILTAMLAFGLHLLITWSIRRVTTSDLGAFNRAMQGRVNAGIVVCGSSRALRHYDPRILSSALGFTCFNLGLAGAQIDVQLGVLRAYLRHNSKPRLLILSLDMGSFWLTKPGHVLDPDQYVPYLGDPEIYSCLGRIEGKLWRWRYVPLYAYAVEDTGLTWISALGSLVGMRPKEVCYDGFCPITRSWTDDFVRFKRAHPNGTEIEIDPEGIRDLERIIELGQRNGFKVVLVYSPEYYEMVGLTRNRRRIFEIFRAIAARYQIPLVDYTDSPICQTRDFFYNSQHLNAQGAKVFSEDLASRLAALPLGDRQPSVSQPRFVGLAPPPDSRDQAGSSSWRR